MSTILNIILLFSKYFYLLIDYLCYFMCNNFKIFNSHKDKPQKFDKY